VSEKLYVEERILVKRWSGPWSILLNTAFILILFYVSWWIFQDPRGIMRMYTPYVGYMWCRWLLVIMIWIAYIFDFWPFNRKWLINTHPVIKGVILTSITVIFFTIVLKLFFQTILGDYAISYFSPERLVKLGIIPFYAEEYSAQAILMFAAIASWLSPAWVVAMESSPWGKLQQPLRGFTILMFTFFISMIVYFVAFHSHMAILFDPWQKFTAITPPWWEGFANTVHGNFNIAWIMCCTVIVWMYETIWERYPFSLIKTDWIRRSASFFGIIVIAVALSFFLYFAQELVWGEAIRGDRRLMAPDWRWLHVGEMAIFWLVPALYMHFYMQDCVTRFSKPINVLLRNIISIIAAIIIYYIYYKTAHLFLGTQKGFSHPQQFPMIPMIWLINIMLINYWFMDGWPGWRLSKDKVVMHNRKIDDDKINITPRFNAGLVVGIIVGIILYFAVVYFLPMFGNLLTIFK
jgi:amino acid transporter, AAT family